MSTPYGLSREQLTQLAELTKSPQWRILSQLLDSIVAFNVDAMLASRELPDLHFRRGAVWTLRQMRDLPETIVTQAKAAEEHDRKQRNKRSAGAANNGGDGWRASLYGSPWWSILADRAKR